MAKTSKKQTVFERMIINVLVSCASIIFILLLLEGLMRLIKFEQTDWFANGPGNAMFARKVKLNSLRFREKEYNGSPAPAGTNRLIILGDSITFGSGILDERKTFPRLLEKELNKTGRRVQVYNASLPGANTYREILLYRQAQTVFPSGLVLLCFFPNDLEPVGGNAPGADKVLAPALPVIPPERREQSYLVHFIDTRLRILMEKRGLRPTYQDYIHGLYKRHSLISQNRNALEILYHEVKANNARLLIASFPLITGKDPFTFPEATRYIQDASHDLNAPFIDLEVDFSREDYERLRISAEDAHLSEEGHLAAAETLSRFIKPYLKQHPQ